MEGKVYQKKDKDKTVEINSISYTQGAEKMIRKKFWHIFDITRDIVLVDHSNLKSTRDLYERPICQHVPSVFCIKKTKNINANYAPQCQENDLVISISNLNSFIY